MNSVKKYQIVKHGCFEKIFQKFSGSTLKDTLDYTQLLQTHIEMNKKGEEYENQENNLLQLHQDEQPENQLMDVMEFNIDKLEFPSFNAMNSLVLDVDTRITNIFSTPLVPGPESSFSAIYTALKQSEFHRGPVEILERQ